MVKISIHNMMFYGFHGYYEYEREQGQKFFFDVEMIVRDDDVKAGIINDSVDTARVYDLLKDATENTRFQTLAELGNYIADKLFGKFEHIDECIIRIRKPSVPIAGPIDYVEVEVKRKKNA